MILKKFLGEDQREALSARGKACTRNRRFSVAMAVTCGVSLSEGQEQRKDGGADHTGSPRGKK